MPHVAAPIGCLQEGHTSTFSRFEGYVLVYFASLGSGTDRAEAWHVKYFISVEIFLDPPYLIGGFHGCFANDSTDE